MEWFRKQKSNYYDKVFKIETRCEERKAELFDNCFDYLDESKPVYKNPEFKKKLDLEFHYLIENCSHKVSFDDLVRYKKLTE